MTPNGTVFLTGFMGAGKTSVGAALARRMGCAFHDLDALIVERAGQSVAEIFQTSGEAGFRKLEQEALQGLLRRLGPEAAVVALGGGTLEQPGSLAAIRGHGGVLVALDAPLETLFARTRRSPHARPLAADEAGFGRLYQRRKPLYQAADAVVEAAGDVEQVAERVRGLVETMVAGRRQT